MTSARWNVSWAWRKLELPKPLLTPWHFIAWFALSPVWFRTQFRPFALLTPRFLQLGTWGHLGLIRRKGVFLITYPWKGILFLLGYCRHSYLQVIETNLSLQVYEDSIRIFRMWVRDAIGKQTLSPYEWIDRMSKLWNWSDSQSFFWSFFMSVSKIRWERIQNSMSSLFHEEIQILREETDLSLYPVNLNSISPCILLFTCE
jgi:hypothetical protein